jgi:hypothetical protein
VQAYMICIATLDVAIMKLEKKSWIIRNKLQYYIRQIFMVFVLFIQVIFLLSKGLHALLY